MDFISNSGKNQITLPLNKGFNQNTTVFFSIDGKEKINYPIPYEIN
jgi:hypothetical protein